MNLYAAIIYIYNPYSRCSDYNNKHCRMQEPAVCNAQSSDGGGFCLIAKDFWGNWIKCNSNADCKSAAENWGNCVVLRECTHVSGFLIFLDMLYVFQIQHY